MPSEKAEVAQEICGTEIQQQAVVPLSTFCSPVTLHNLVQHNIATQNFLASNVPVLRASPPVMQQHPLQAHTGRREDRYTLRGCLYNNPPCTQGSAGQGKATSCLGSGQPARPYPRRSRPAKASAPASHLAIDLRQDAFAVGRSPQGGQVRAHGVHQAHVQRARRNAERALQHVVCVRVLRGRPPIITGAHGQKCEDLSISTVEATTSLCCAHTPVLHLEGTVLATEKYPSCFWCGNSRGTAPRRQQSRVVAQPAQAPGQAGYPEPSLPEINPKPNETQGSAPAAGGG